MKFKVKREVTLLIDAQDKATALKLAGQWRGSTAVGGAGISCGVHRVKWNGKSKHLSLKIVKTIPINKGK